VHLVITGSSSGIGRALAAHFLGGGHQVWGLARSAQDDFAAAPGGSFRSSRCDVSSWPEVAAAAAAIGEAWPALDGVICCAGWQGEIGRALAADPLRWTATVRANLEGTYYTLRAFSPLLARSRRPKLICFSGGGSTKPRPNFSAYGAAKTAIVRLVETIAAEEGSRLDINAVAPGPVTTRMTDEVLRLGAAVVGPADYEAARKQKEGGGASPERAVALVDWLLSSASDGISGRLLSAPWDAWDTLAGQKNQLATSDAYTLRRVEGPPKRT
jgi:NAD(P)-dependent dehydrogenase (short-subunit alcohol dehydrogenase family)